MPITKKPRNASLKAQKVWHNFPGMLKKELRGQLPDRDGDGVPNGFDCHPCNPRRQEEFLPRDLKFLNTHPKVRLGKFLGKGCVGEVRSLIGNKNLVIKTVRSYEGKNGDDVVPDIRDGKFATRELKKEADDYTKYNLEQEPLFIPTRAVKVGKKRKLGLIRPKIHIVSEYYPKFHINNKNLITEKSLRELREKIIADSKKGFVFVDGLQLGIDDTSRILMYDIGFMEKDKPGSDRAFMVNNAHWEEFISQFSGGKAKYGGITKGKPTATRKTN